MRLRSLRVTNLRILEDAELCLDADLVVLAGANGSGKTSILEAVHLLGTGRSFRSRSIQDVIRRGAGQVLVRGEAEDPSGAPSVVGVEKSRAGAARFRLAGEDVRSSSVLARHLPLVLLTPDSQRLLSDGAEVRRRLLDWLLFHVEPGYQQAHARFRRALRQRNAVLRQGGADRAQRELWCRELADTAQELEALREKGLEPAMAAAESELSRLTELAVALRYRPGRDPGEDLYARLLDDWPRDEVRGFTGRGPHRADLEVLVDERPAQHVASRGEGKLLAVAVLVAFAQVLGRHLPSPPLVLVDELASELDAGNRARFSRALLDLGMQTFVTAVSEELVSRDGWERVQVFRMQQGKVVPVLQ